MAGKSAGRFECVAETIPASFTSPSSDLHTSGPPLSPYAEKKNEQMVINILQAVYKLATYYFESSYNEE
ncbi:unnamed protein product [Echinostoma caproni]|uniref:Peroxisomal membrane protein PEX16 n=1 Tax=Echinostoma caproni TaxID=27848 RepID=A0A183AYI6_9TREM|nr:unnamed protein product [Echinostoma caproni]